jgi:hypothetical protein
VADIRKWLGMGCERSLGALKYCRALTSAGTVLYESGVKLMASKCIKYEDKKICNKGLAENEYPS